MVQGRQGLLATSPTTRRVFTEDEMVFLNRELNDGSLTIHQDYDEDAIEEASLYIQERVQRYNQRAAELDRKNSQLDEQIAILRTSLKRSENRDLVARCLADCSSLT